MTRYCNPYLLLISVFVILTHAGCEPRSDEKFTIERSYYYTIRASINGNNFSGDGPTHFELRPKNRRRVRFRHLPEKPSAIMYAYRLTSNTKYNEKLHKSVVVSGDTIEVVVTAPQADSLFNLAKAVFESVSVSNVDTVYSKPKMSTFWTDDASGSMGIESRYGNIQLDVGPLHSSSNRQAAPFRALYSRFKALFPEGK